MKVKGVLKWVAIAVPLLLVAAIAFIVGSSYFEHRKLVEQEKAVFPAPGVLVDVNNDGHKIHVYAEGEGSPTLVFLSGFGTPSPVYDFKALTLKK